MNWRKNRNRRSACRETLSDSPCRRGDADVPGGHLCLSVFVLPLKQIAAILQSTAQLPFSLFYFAFPATMIVTGTLLPRIGPRRCAVVGGLLFGGGWMLASMGRVHFAFTILGIGLMAGIGVGFAYIVPIATCVRWFPLQKGWSPA